MTVRASTLRSPSATVCHDVSIAAWGVRDRRAATKVPLPGLVTTVPSAASAATARATVTGLTL
ncbi:hypothetical protein GCM10023176_58900 [Micromonospora coerulea]|uniref:Uncharacterized protein n=1 Tax=Micromonospora coerulea TaxID=47856 RepID=A0ABP8T5F2_9ACTN